MNNFKLKLILTEDTDDTRAESGEKKGEWKGERVSGYQRLTKLLG